RMFQAFLEVFHLGHRDLVLLLGLVVGLVEFGQLLLELFVALLRFAPGGLCPRHAGGQQDRAHSDTPGRQETTARARTGFRVAKQGIAAFLPTSVYRRRHPEKTPVARCDGTGGRGRPTPWGDEGPGSTGLLRRPLLLEKNRS